MFDYQKFPKIDLSNKRISLEGKINSLCKSYAKLKEQTHIVLFACIEHAVTYRNASLVTKLWNDLPANANKPMIGAWIKAVSSLEYRENKGGDPMWLGMAVKGKKIYDWKDKGLAEATPFYEMNGANTPKPDTYDLFALLERLVERAGKRKADGKLPQDQAELLAKLQPFYSEVVTHIVRHDDKDIVNTAIVGVPHEVRQ